MPFAATRAAHAPILERASAVAQVRGLSIRIEQTNLHWAMRSIGFLGNADLGEQGAGRVGGASPILAALPLRTELGPSPLPAARHALAD